jgi:hypothetical protein
MFDNIDISCTSQTVNPVTLDNDPVSANPTLANGVPANLVLAADNFGLNPGQSMQVTYRVTVDNPTPAGQGSVDNTASVVSTQQATPQSASTTDLLPLVTLGNFVWYDTDGDGVQVGGEPGVSGVTVRLYDPGPNGVIGGGDDVLVAATTTDAAGGYAFNSRVADNYYLEFTLPTGYSFTGQDQGGNEATDSDANATTGQTVLFGLTAGVNNNDLDVGLANSQLDYGDLLASYDNTILGENGARHLISTLRLGNGIGPDPEGQESPTATGDTFDDGVLHGSQSWLNGATIDLQIDLQGATGSGLAAVGIWID